MPFPQNKWFNPEFLGYSEKAKVAWLRSPVIGAVRYLFVWTDEPDEAERRIVVEVWTSGGEKKNSDYFTREDARYLWERLVTKHEYVRFLPVGDYA